MPEGDTLVNTAAQLRPVLAGRPLTRIEVRRNRWPLPRPGTVVDAVDAAGKHLLITFADGNVLQSHLGMTGSWHVYRAGQRWRDDPGAIRARVAVADHEAVLFRAPTVRLWPPGLAEERPWHRLGPDLCTPPVDVAEIVTRVRAGPADREIADVLLDQHVAAGIGNVYKSEALHACGIHPRTPVGSLDDARLVSLYTTASAQLVANIGRWKRRTHPRGLAVYGRDRQGCRRCHSAVRSTRQGDLDRITYWCPRCQPGP
jgi:endonuclease VIII